MSLIPIPSLALTCWPEWVYAIDELFKRVEMRKWTPPAALVNANDAWLGLHAGARVGGQLPIHLAIDKLVVNARRAGHEATWTATRGRKFDAVIGGKPVTQDDMKTSALVGVIRVTRIVRDGDAEELEEAGVRGWYDNDDGQKVGWRFEYRRLETPVPCAGKEKLWTIPAAVRERMIVREAA